LSIPAEGRISDLQSISLVGSKLLSTMDLIAFWRSILILMHMHLKNIVFQSPYYFSSSKVQIFWEEHKNLKKLPILFFKLLWPSQNIWTLHILVLHKNLVQIQLKKNKNICLENNWFHCALLYLGANSKFFPLDRLWNQPPTHPLWGT
jgi:hypothetical protein